MSSPEHVELGQRLTAEILAPMKAAFVGKDEIIDLLGISLVAGEHLFLLGPPGTAKSALVQDLARRIHGRVFDYLLTRFTEPNELFGPFDIRKLREGDLVTNTEGMLPEASLVFLDELLNANSAILNSLLMVLNERVFRRGRETRLLPLLMVVSASNRLPEDDALGALFDRFLLRVRCDNVAPERLADVLEAGWKLDLPRAETAAVFDIEDIRRLNRLLAEVELGTVRTAYVELVHRLRHAGIPISDRRAVKLQRLLGASACCVEGSRSTPATCGCCVTSGTRKSSRKCWPRLCKTPSIAAAPSRRRVIPRAGRRRARCGMPGKRFAAHCPACGRRRSARHGEKLSQRPAWPSGGPLPMGQGSAAARVPRAAGRGPVETAGCGHVKANDK